MPEFGPEVSDTPKKGGETIFKTPSAAPSTESITPAGIASIQGKTSEQPVSTTAATAMTLEEKALQPTPSEVLTPQAIASIQGKTG